MKLATIAINDVGLTFELTGPLRRVAKGPE